MMDVRIGNVHDVRRRRMRVGAAIVAVFLLLMVLAVWMGMRPPAVDGDSIWTGTVERGELLHEVVAAGRLVADEVRAVTNRAAGVVEQRRVLPGDRVEVGDVLLVMASPELDEELAAARWELAEARANEVLAEVESDNEKLDLEAQVARAEADYTSTRLELEAQEQLGEGQVFSSLEVQRTRLEANQLKKRLDAERARLARFDEVRRAEREAAEARLGALADRLARLEALRDDLEVKAGMPGVVLEITPEEGARLPAGEPVARIVDPDRLIARVAVDERSASRVRVGLPAELELGRVRLDGRVVRVDPGVENRLVDVDIELLDEAADAQLRPDLSVTARIELERIEDTLKLDRPSRMPEAGGAVELFRLTDGGKRARRVEVEVGRASMREVEVVAGLEAGDRVILADMSEWMDHEAIRIR